MKSTPPGLSIVNDPAGLPAEARMDYEILRSACGSEWRCFRNEDGFPELVCVRLKARMFVWSVDRIACQFETTRSASMKGAFRAILEACPSAQWEQQGDFEAIISVRRDEGRALSMHMKPWRIPSLSEQDKARRRKLVSTLRSPLRRKPLRK